MFSRYRGVQGTEMLFYVLSRSSIGVQGDLKNLWFAPYVFPYTLQSKEKLISSLKEGSSLEGLDSHITSSMELEETRHERDMQREDIQKLLAQTQQLKVELQVGGCSLMLCSCQICTGFMLQNQIFSLLLPQRKG